jgi:hypothetical protein
MSGSAVNNVDSYPATKSIRADFWSCKYYNMKQEACLKAMVLIASESNERLSNGGYPTRSAKPMGWFLSLRAPS